MKYTIIAMRGRGEKGFMKQELEERKDGKTNSLTTVQKDNFIKEEIVVHNMMPRSSKTGKGGTGPLSRNDGKTYCLDTSKTNAIEIKELNENQLKKFNPNVNASKANTLTLAQGRAGSSGEYMDSVSKIAKITSKIRRLTPVECERLQTVEDSYTNHVSDSQRYKMLGNGWTVDVIAHIFSYINQ